MAGESGEFRKRRELGRPSRVREIRRAETAAPGARESGPAGGLVTTNRFSSRSRPALPAEILGGFSSSLLPPSFPRGRSATFFFASRRRTGGGCAGRAAAGK
jgi:hypothetical protein